MNHFVLHDAADTVAVVVVEGIKSGQELNGWIMDDNRHIKITAGADIPIGHKIALKDMKTGDTVIKYGVDIGKADLWERKAINLISLFDDDGE